MSTLGSLMLALSDPGIEPYNAQELTANRIQFGNAQNQTQLLALADLKRQQEAQQLARQYYQQHPEALLGGGGSVLGSLGPAGGPAGGGPMLQQTVMPGQPPGAPQVVPGGQDLSQFATQGGPPQSTLGGLGPQPQAQGPAQAHPLEQLMRTNPDAAFAVMQRAQQQEDVRLKRGEARLSTGTKVLEYVGRQAQGVTDQASLDAMRQDLSRLQLHQYAAQLPQVYSKEAMAPFIAKALDVKDSLTLQVQDLQAQAAVIKARKEGRATDVDNQLRGMGVQPGQETPEAMREALRMVKEDKKEVSAAHGSEAARIERTEKPLEGAAGKAVSDLSLLRKMTDDVGALRKDAYTGPWVGRTGYVREQAGLMDPEETAFRSTLQNMKDILGRLRSGANIPASEMANLERLLPTYPDPPETFKAKMQSFQRALEQQREELLKVGTTGRQQLREETTPTTPRVGEKPTSQGSTGTPKPVSQMSAEETRAEIAAIKARGGK